MGQPMVHLHQILQVKALEHLQVKVNLIVFQIQFQIPLQQLKQQVFRKVIHKENQAEYLTEPQVLFHKELTGRIQVA